MKKNREQNNRKTDWQVDSTAEGVSSSSNHLKVKEASSSQGKPRDKELPFAENTSKESLEKPKKKKKKSLFIWVLDFLIVALLLSGAYLLLKPYYTAWKQDQVIDEMEAVMTGTEETWGFWVDPNANKVEGEAIESFSGSGETTPSVAHLSRGTGDEEEFIYEEAPVYLEILGKIKNASIELDMPLLRGADVVQLRYGAGWYEPSAPLGEKGRATILGHSYNYIDRFFTMLSDIEIGDTITIEQQNRILHYQMYDYKVIPAEELWQYLTNEDTESEIMLVTCYPRYVWDQRYLLFAKLTSIEVKP